MNLEGKVALVTGASRGIGRAIAAALGAQSACVIGTATTDKGAETITQRFNDEGIKGQGFKLNVTDADEIAAVIKQIQEQYGAPEILVNNAGITKDNLLMRMKPDEWQDVISTNLGSMYSVSKACIRGMSKARWGRIVNVSSVVGSMGNAGQTNYAASKAGVEGFTRALAREIGSRGVTVNSVAPGFIDTDMTKALEESQRDSLASQIPLNRLGSAEEVAAVVAFLCSDLAGYVTGETLHVNGGLYMA
ncbi:MAG: 3-oxoacyl-ACP reductase FabG [Pseudomonadales bacterium]|nr:3-oxoacyl-ACP reductase FabG [Pseudomonadales bacterium]